MAIDPQNIDVTTVANLPTGAFSLVNLLVQSNPQGLMTKNTQSNFAAFIAPYVAAIGSSGYVNVTSNALPTPSGNNSFSLVGKGTFTHSGGNVTANGDLNIIYWNGTLWSLAKEISIDLSDINQSISDIENELLGIRGDNRDFSTYSNYAMPDYAFASFVDKTPIHRKSKIGIVNVKAITPSSAILFVSKKTTGNNLKILFTLPISLSVGNNSFDLSDKKYTPFLEKGDFVGIYAPGSNSNTALAKDSSSNPNRYRRGLNTVSYGAEFEYLDDPVSLAFNYTLIYREDIVLKLSNNFDFNSSSCKLIKNASIINDVFPIQGGDKSVIIVPYTTSSFVWINGIDYAGGGSFKWAFLKQNFERVAQISVVNSVSPHLIQTSGSDPKWIAFETELLTSDFNIYNQTSNVTQGFYSKSKSEIISINNWNDDKKENLIKFDVRTIAGEKNTRQDQADMLRMSNGDMICAYTNFYTSQIEDDAPSKVSYRTSADNGLKWGLERDIPQSEYSNMIPIFHKKVDGTIICLILANIEGAILENYIYKVKSNDGAVSWSSPEKVIEIVGQYLVTKPGTIIVGKDNSLLLPMSQYNKITGGYFGLIYRSTDDGETWTKLSLTIDNGQPNSTIVETDLFIRKDSKYAFSFRSGSGRLDALLSDDLVTMIPGLVNISLAPESQSAVKYIPGSDIYIACYNKFNGIIRGATGARKDLAIAFSRDGVSFKEYPELIYKGFYGEEQAIEPTIYKDPTTGNVFILFSPCNYYPENAIQYFNVASVILTPEIISRITSELNI